MNISLAENIIWGRRAVALARQRGQDTSDWERLLSELLDEAGREPSDEEGLETWMLWEWRRVSIPEWRRILQISLDQDDSRREAYARWMLREVLLDPDYCEPA